MLKLWEHYFTILVIALFCSYLQIQLVKHAVILESELETDTKCRINKLPTQFDKVALLKYQNWKKKVFLTLTVTYRKILIPFYKYILQMLYKHPMIVYLI